MKSRIPSPSVRVETLVALGTRSTALLAKEPAVADLAPLMAEANERLVRANAARKEAGAARFGASRDQKLAMDALVAMVRVVQHALLVECQGTRAHESYRALFPKGQAPLFKGYASKRMAAFTEVATQLQAEPAHADLAKRFGDALAAWKAALDAHVVARANEAAAVKALDQARLDWTLDCMGARSQAESRLRSVQAAKEFFPTTVRKADDGTDAEAGAKGAAGTGGGKPAGAAGGNPAPEDAAKLGEGAAVIPEVPVKGNGKLQPDATAPASTAAVPPADALKVA